MRVAIITYYYEPYTGVGALRPVYWAKHMNEIDPEITCDVITAQNDCTERALPGGGSVISVEDVKRFSINSFVRIDAGAQWIHSLRDHFRKTEMKYDAVIFTGGPFLHFFLAEELKKRTGCRVIFDFRDPFANNPNHKLNFIKRFIKKFLERKMLKIPDICITVNEYCRDLMEQSTLKVEVIDNGYDETIIDGLNKSGASYGHRFVYAGKFYPGASPEPFLEALSDESVFKKCTFDYMGPDPEKVEIFNKGNFCVSSSVPYLDAIKRISNADTGIIFTGGQPFESTTKVFDYIGLEKNILIITNGEQKSGNIHKITKDYPNVHWVSNDHSEILETVKKIIYLKPVKFPLRHAFSRKDGLRKLIDAIKKIR